MSSQTAYILQVHKNPNQVNKFIQQLISEGEADVYIHIDKKSYRGMIDKIISSPHVKILEQSVSCEWGDISQVDATIMLLKEVIASKKPYDFVCLRSGQDLIVKNGFKEFLINNENTIFINHRYLNEENSAQLKINWPKITRKRYTTAHPLRIYRKILLDFYSKGFNLFPNTNSWPKEYKLYKGSQWFTIPYSIAQYILDFLDANDWYYKFFVNTLVPDESFFQTLILNSPYKSKVVNSNLMFLNWGDSLSSRNSPLDLLKRDIPAIEESNQFFARKFDEHIDNSVIQYFVNKAHFGSRTEEAKEYIF